VLRHESRITTHTGNDTRRHESHITTHTGSSAQQHRMNAIPKRHQAAEGQNALAGRGNIT